MLCNSLSAFPDCISFSWTPSTFQRASSSLEYSQLLVQYDLDSHTNFVPLARKVLFSSAICCSEASEIHLLKEEC